jgi:HPt (histidine-containing phosphotransfer) domain-containing protein
MSTHTADLPDPAIWATLTQSPNGDLVEICGIYGHEIQERLIAIRLAIAAKDAKALVLSAHNLRSVGLTFGASKLALHAATLEQQGNAEDFGAAALVVATAVDEFVEVRAIVQCKLAHRDKSSGTSCVLLTAYHRGQGSEQRRFAEFLKPRSSKQIS